jgi:hypothetical protein
VANTAAWWANTVRVVNTGWHGGQRGGRGRKDGVVVGKGRWPRGKHSRRPGARGGVAEAGVEGREASGGVGDCYAVFCVALGAADPFAAAGY